ncbi:MAG: hypothetical protein Q9181_002563 [Wetmoreana brouardii]
MFYQAQTASNPKLTAMHKAWFRCRRPTHELMASRHPANGSYQRTAYAHIPRKVLTLTKLLEQATQTLLVTEIQRLLLGYSMLMRVTCTSPNDPAFQHFRDLEDRIFGLVEILGASGHLAPTSTSEAARTEGAASATSAARNIVSIIAPEIRANIERLRVNPTAVILMGSISGNVQAKGVIQTAIMLPTVLPHLAVEGLESENILLHGPPGTGKTLLAMASAAEDKDCSAWNARASDLIVRWQGCSEQNIAALFAIAAENVPAIIVIDDVEGLCRSRQAGQSTFDDSTYRIANEFMANMTKYASVTVIGTTNLPWDLDHAFGRRFGTKVHVGLPSDAERLDMIEHQLKRLSHDLTRSDMSQFACSCKDFTGDAVIRAIKSALKALLDEIRRATHFRPIIVKGKRMY